MQMQIINKLPEVIKCIIYDYVSYKLNYLIESYSDKFIGNPVCLSKIYDLLDFELYHINKLTKFKTPLSIIELHCEEWIPEQNILNKLIKFRLVVQDDISIINLPNVQILTLNINKLKCFPIIGKYLHTLECNYLHDIKEIPYLHGLKKLDCSGCYALEKIPAIVGLKELSCNDCCSLTEIPYIESLQILNCSCCPNIRNFSLDIKNNIQITLSFFERSEEWIKLIKTIPNIKLIDSSCTYSRVTECKEKFYYKEEILRRNK